MFSRSHVNDRVFIQELPPIGHLDLQPNHRDSSQPVPWNDDPFLRPRSHQSNSSYAPNTQLGSINQPVRSLQPTPRLAPSSHLIGQPIGASLQRTSHPSPGTYGIDGSRPSFSDSLQRSPHLAQSLENLTPPLGWSLEKKTSDAGLKEAHREEHKRRKMNNHALSEKDRREVMNFQIRKLKDLTFPEYWDSVTSRTPRHNDEAKNEILKYSVAFIMALAHSLILESPSNAELWQENIRLREEKAALISEVCALRDRWNDRTPHQEPHDRQTPQLTASDQQRHHLSEPPPCHPNTSRNPSSVKDYRRCIDSAHDSWIEGVMKITNEIASTRQGLLTEAIDTARSQGRTLTKELLESLLD